MISITYAIWGESDLIAGLGDLWPVIWAVAVAGRDKGRLETLILDGCLKPGAGEGASWNKGQGYNILSL